MNPIASQAVIAWMRVMQIKLRGTSAHRQSLAGMQLLVAICLFLFPYSVLHATQATIHEVWPDDIGALTVEWSWNNIHGVCIGSNSAFEYRKADSSVAWPSETNWGSSTDNTSESGMYVFMDSYDGARNFDHKDGGSMPTHRQYFTIGKSGGKIIGKTTHSNPTGSYAFTNGAVALGDARYEVRVVTGSESVYSDRGDLCHSNALTGSPIMGPGGLVISPSVLVLNEGGGSGEFSVRLAAKPTENVTVGWSSASGPIAVKTANILTFTPSNWNVAQMVEIDPETDADSVPDDVEFSFGAAGAIEYSVGTHQTVKVRVDEGNPSARIMVSPVGGLSVTEGVSNFVEIKLSKMPTKKVTMSVDLIHPDASDKKLSMYTTPLLQQSRLHFLLDSDAADDIAEQTSLNDDKGADYMWNTTKRINISALNRDQDLDDETGTIVVTVDSGTDIAPEYAGQVIRIPVKLIDHTDSTDPNYTNLKIEPVIVTSPDSTLNLKEGQDSLVSVVLSTFYTGFVSRAKVTVSGENSKVSVEPLSDNAYTINGKPAVNLDANSVEMASRDSPVRFRVTAQRDADNSDETVTLTFNVASTTHRDSENNFLALESKTVTVNVDDEPVPSVSFTTPSSKDANIIASFSHYVGSSSDSITRFTDSTIDSLITLAQGSKNGTAIPFDATISGHTITINPTNDLPTGNIYVGVSDGFWNDFGVRGNLSETTFAIKGLSVSVADARVAEAAGAKFAFKVSLSRAVEAADGTVSVKFATSDGTATAGSDYTATSGTLTFNAGQSSQIIHVNVLNDEHNEGNETLKVTLSDAVGVSIADSEAWGFITNTDPLPKAWISRLVRTMAEQHIDVVTQAAGCLA